MRVSAMIDARLLQAYRETDYVVIPGMASGVDGRFTLRIGVASPLLANLYRRHDAVCAAFITAFNPHSRRVTAARNQAAQARLRAWTRRRGYTCLEGVGRHPSGAWPGEPSLLVLAMPRAVAQQVARDYGQNAIVWCDRDAVPRLVFADEA